VYRATVGRTDQRCARFAQDLIQHKLGYRVTIEVKDPSWVRSG